MEEIFVTRTSMPSFQEYCDEIRSLWDSHLLTNMGEKHQALQGELERFLHCPLTLFANGHLALEAILEALQLPKGAEVITSPFTFVSTTHALVRRGLTPVFCDVLEADGTLDPAQAEALITERTAALLPVHVYGHPCDVERLEVLARRHGLKLIFDAAHAFGVQYKGRPAVSFGDASILSFHATKVFSTVEGGAVCFPGGSLRRQLEDLSNFGIRDTELCAAVGGNAKLNEFQAAMGLCNLRHFADEVSKRKAAFELYQELLPEGVRFLLPREGVTPNYSYCPVVFDSRATRDRVHDTLLQHGIHPRKYFYPLTSQAACYAGQFRSHTPVAENLSARVLTLPLYADLPQSDIHRICQLVRETL